MKVTIKEVAKEVGVSIATVSRVLNGNGRYSPETRRKVEAAIARLNYRPDQAARALVRNETKLIGVNVPTLTNEYWALFAELVGQQLSRRGYTMVLCTDGEEEGSVRSLGTFVERRVDGIIYKDIGLQSDSNTPSGIQPFIDSGIPVVGYEQTHPSIQSIGSDHQAGAKMAVEHLVKLGHRRIAYLGGSEVGVERERGYSAAMKAAGYGVNEALVIRVPWTYEGGFAGGDTLVRSGEPFSAIVCGNDLIAIGAIRALESHGLACPRDAAVVGYDDIRMARLFKPALTTIRQPIAPMAVAVVDLLMSRLSGKTAGIGLYSARFPMELVVRESCGTRR